MKTWSWPAFSYFSLRLLISSELGAFTGALSSSVEDRPSLDIMLLITDSVMVTVADVDVRSTTVYNSMV